MNLFFANISVLFAFIFSSVAHSASLEDIKNQLQSQPYMSEKPKDNDAIFAKYCVGNPNSAAIPQPLYSNELVILAAKKLTESKVLADARLKEMAKEQFLSGVENVKNLLNDIVTQSKNKGMVDLAKELLLELNKPNLNTISPEISAIYNKMTQWLFIRLKNNVKHLAPELAVQLKGIDLAVFAQLVKKAQTLALAELKPLDLAQFKTTYSELYSLIESSDTSIDYAKIKSAALEIGSFSYQGADKNIAGLFEAVKSSAKGLIEVIDSKNYAEANYLLSDVRYFLAELKANNYSSPQHTQLMTVFDEATAKISLVSLASSAKFLAGLIDSAQPDMMEIQYAAQDMAYVLQNNLDTSEVLFFDKSKTPLVHNFIAQTKLMNTNKILKDLESTIDFLNLNTAEANESAINIIYYGLAEVEQLPNLSLQIKTVIDELKVELAKKSSQEIIDTVNSTNVQLQEASEFNSELYYGLSYLDFSQKFSLQPATQDLLNELVLILEEGRSIVNLSSYMNLDGKAKGADHFYFYGGVRRLYELTDMLPEAAINAGANKEAHWFITQLCGEFRDRATMIEAKLKWIQNMNILPQSDVLVVEPDTLAQAKNVWLRITANAYSPYLIFSSDLWEARRSGQNPFLQIGSIANIDNPVLGTTVCETKYIFAQYIAVEKSFDSLEEYNTGYEMYKKQCPAQDLTDYYDFRGDSNFKHYSPESNGMIWQATSLARGCKSSTKAGKGIYTDEDCKKYFERPFFSRYNAARAGLAAWLFRDDKHADKFSAQGQMVAIYPHKQPELAPFSFGFTQESIEGALFDFNPNWLGVPFAWNSPDIGFNGLTGLGTNNSNPEQAYKLIRDAVDRHTDWYNSGYNDGNGTSRDQAYSPFVASSYVMSSSDGFTSCGTTVQCPPDGLKRWMFIFRIKAQNWYTPLSIQNNQPIDFDKMWFDETSFGISNLADSEHAWDRLGTAQEEELDSILYLINVDSGYDSTEEFGHDEEGE